jgi:hypothetical protein
MQTSNQRLYGITQKDEDSVMADIPVHRFEIRLIACFEPDTKLTVNKVYDNILWGLIRGKLPCDEMRVIDRGKGYSIVKGITDEQVKEIFPEKETEEHTDQVETTDG